MYFLEFIYSFCSYIRAGFQLNAFVREHVWHKAELMGYSMRLEFTCACSLNGFQLVMFFFMNAGPFFFLEFVLLSLRYPSFTFDILYVVCACVLEWFGISLVIIFSVCVNVCRVIFFFFVYICIFVFICMCEWFMFYSTLVCLVLWHINLCRLFNAKSIFM